MLFTHVRAERVPDRQGLLPLCARVYSQRRRG